MDDIAEEIPSTSKEADNNPKAEIAESSSASSAVSDSVSPVQMRDRRFRSIVEDQGIYKSTCGYCKRSSRTSVAHGLWAFSLTVNDYQGLIDRGWRRSGMFLYKPHMKSTCCPPYTIRLEAESFHPTKDQRRVLRRMERFLEGTFHDAETVGDVQLDRAGFKRESKSSSDHRKLSISDGGFPTYESFHSAYIQGVPEVPKTDEERLATQLKVAIETSIKSCVDSHSLPGSLNTPPVVVKRLPPRVKAKLSNNDGDIHYTSSIAFAVAALLRRRTKNQSPDIFHVKDREAFTPDIGPGAVAKMLAEHMPSVADLPACTVTHASGHLNFMFVGSDAVKHMPCKYESFPQQMCGGKNNISSRQKPFQSQMAAQPLSSQSSSRYKLEIRLKRSSFDPEEFALYQKYQVRIHNDRPEDVRESRYRRFLVDSPLIFEPPQGDGHTPTCGFGSFHQQYLMDGKLIAVGVIDILPQCLSSKYLFWDPDMYFLGLGKYAALKEISWVQGAQQICPSLQYYYLGFYIHSCPKMRYKAAYHPSELLCPETLRWVPYDICVPYLDKSPYVCLAEISSERSSATKFSGQTLERKEISADSASDSESEDSAMESETNFSGVERHEGMDVDMNFLIDKDVTPPLQSNELLDAVQLCWNKTFMSYKHVREFALIPQWHLYTLSRNLNKYIQDVGPFLASRMAYALG